MALINLRKKFDMSARKFYYLSVIYNTLMSGKLIWKPQLRGIKWKSVFLKSKQNP